MFKSNMVASELSELYLLYVPSNLTFNNAAFCPECI
jgi:hypothetical protein